MGNFKKMKVEGGGGGGVTIKHKITQYEINCFNGFASLIRGVISIDISVNMRSIYVDDQNNNN